MKKKEKVSIFRNGVLVIGASRLGAYIAMSLQQAGRIGDVCNTIYEVPKIYIRLNDSDKVKLLVDSKIKAICPFLLSVEKFYEMYNE